MSDIDDILACLTISELAELIRRAADEIETRAAEEA